MQEEVENRTVTLIISTSKFSGRILKDAVEKYLAYKKSRHLNKQRDGPVIPHGKQSVKALVEQNQGVSNLELKDRSIRDFEHIARRYGVDYAVRKDRSCDPPKYLIFFKARDADVLTSALTEYSAKKIRNAERPSVIEKLHRQNGQVKSQPAEHTKKKELPER